MTPLPSTCVTWPSVVDDTTETAATAIRTACRISMSGTPWLRGWRATICSLAPHRQAGVSGSWGLPRRKA